MTVFRTIGFYLEDTGSVMTVVCGKFVYCVLSETRLQLNANPFAVIYGLLSEASCDSQLSIKNFVAIPLIVINLSVVLVRMLLASYNSDFDHSRCIWYLTEPCSTAVLQLLQSNHGQQVLVIE